MILFLFRHFTLFIIHYSLLQEVVCQFLCGSCAVADTVLDIHTQFSKRLVVASRLEDGIIAEALPSPTFSDNLAFDDTLEFVDLLDARTTTRADIFLLY